MESSRDSSIWRSLAVAFGDGLAFGVGMKLTQHAGRQTAEPEDNTPAGRLAELERRLARVERSPAALPPSASLPAQFDQKVLEAVVKALEARLKEQADHVERRLAELDAKITIELKALDRVDHSLEDRVAAASRDFHEALPKAVDEVEAKLDERTSLLHRVEHRVDGLEDRFAGFRAELMEALPKAVDERGRALLNQMDDLVNAMEDRMVAMHHELASGVESRAAELSQQVANTAMAAMDSVLEPKLAALRTALADRHREIAELRHQLAESDRRSVELLSAIGNACRQAAAQMDAPPGPVEIPSRPQDPPAPPTAEISPETPPPGFTQTRAAGRILKLPLVSSMVVSVGLGGLVLLHYL